MSLNTRKQQFQLAPNTMMRTKTVPAISSKKSSENQYQEKDSFNSKDKKIQIFKNENNMKENKRTSLQQSNLPYTNSNQYSQDRNIISNSDNSIHFKTDFCGKSEFIMREKPKEGKISENKIIFRIGRK